MLSSRTNDNVEKDIHDGYVQSHSIGDVSSVERGYDRAGTWVAPTVTWYGHYRPILPIVESGTGLSESGAFTFVKSFYDQNQRLIEATATGLASLTSEGRSIESAVNSFSATAKVIITGLDALAQVHPAIGLAVLAFKLVITFDMTRRENNKKVLALKIEMQDMMIVLFELRHIRDPAEAGPDGTLLDARIQALTKKIAKDIKDAGSACDVYMKKSFLARTLKSKIYEDKLAEFCSAFESNKAELQRALSIHTARWVYAANEKLGSIENQIDQIFRKLDSPEEKDIQRFFEENGGPRICIESEYLLAKLVEKSGETLAEAIGLIQKVEDLGSAREALLKEWDEDIEEIIRKNFAFFEEKLKMQSAQLQDTIWLSSEYIVNTLRSGPDERIVDQDLKTIWKEMGWRGNVEARHFVLALYDYYNDGVHRISQPSNAHEVGNTTTLPAPIMVDDKWALAYVNVVYVQPIMEAVDDDGTGFVSIKEVNMFANSAPRDFGRNLLQRLAYWAAGWHISVSSYKTKIYSLVGQMFQLRTRMATPNRRLVDEYLATDNHTLLCVECILRSMQSVKTTGKDAELVKLIDTFEMEEEVRLEKRLSSLAYKVDSVETVILVTGPGRIERYLLPLIYLILKHDLRIMMVACKCVSHKKELLGSGSLYSVFEAVDERVERTTGIFKQLHADVDMRLGALAFGMELYGRGGIIPKKLDNSFLKRFRESSSDEAEQRRLQTEIDLIPITDLQLLKFGPLDFSDHEKGFLNPVYELPDIPGGLTPSGRWSGHLWYRRPKTGPVSYLGLLDLQIDVHSDGKITGLMQGFSAISTIEGTLNQENDMKFELDVTGLRQACEVRFDPNMQRMEGLWRANRFASHSPLDFHFLFLRTPGHLDRFRYSLSDFRQNPARARWTFARDAVLEEVRRKLCSWMFLKTRIGEIRRLVELLIRRTSGYRNFAPYNDLTEEERDEIYTLLSKTDVRVARLCQFLAEFHVDRLTVRGIFCNSCGPVIHGTRFLCLVCVDKDCSDHIDVCRACLTKSPRHEIFTHDPSHSMIKFEQVVHDYSFDIPLSRNVAARAKLVLKAMEEASSCEDDASEQTLEVCCLCCLGPVAVPCWVCRVCVPDTFICRECEEKGVAPPKNHTHSLIHSLIRIGTTNPDPRSMSDKLTLEERLVALDTKVDKGMTQLGERVNQLEAKVRGRLTQLESKIEEKFSVIESLLRQVIVQAEGAPQGPLTRS
ncbi:hypothetical protein BDN72DRAFT_929692 [Pluteus cervinus]|uniref:Uncharacterized protein n=1 Tax=Pluteus cervinus TaxID=181527 RepID=A0ACD3AB72_9AGAR|nr:hypothetical protein BDN72DRAFT_929692 [Pluteus cervinus]